MTLDLEKFRKVRALADAGSTAGERAAAKSRLEAMARKAGLTLSEALLHDDTDKGGIKSPWTAEQMAAYWAEEARKEKSQFEAAEPKCRRREATMAESERERLLRDADLEILRDMDAGRNLRAEMTRRSGGQRRPSPVQLDLFI